MAYGLFLFIVIFLEISQFSAGDKEEMGILDEKVNTFLDKQRGKWSNWNVPETDGRLLYDLIIKNRYTKVLDIGTSTGHSAIWMAWALTRAGERPITIEIDEDRHMYALANFKEAGLSSFIDARLADANDLARKGNVGSKMISINNESNYEVKTAHHKE